jgi:hypothetical protein
MVPDSKFRAALDLAIFVGPYNGAITAITYNDLLAKLMGEPKPSEGPTLLTKTANYKTANISMSVYGPALVNQDVLSAFSQKKFAFRDSTGSTFEDGTVEVSVVRQGSVGLDNTDYYPETLVNLNFPEGSEAEAMKIASETFSTYSLQSEKVPSNYLPSSRPKESSNAKRVVGKYSSLRSAIIRQASAVDPTQRGPWLPVLRALKSL